MAGHQIPLVDATTGQIVEGWLHERISEDHLDTCRRTWSPAFAKLKDAIKSGAAEKDSWPEDAHWDWELKVAHYSHLLAYKCFCITQGDIVEALMLLGAINVCRHPAQRGKDLVYVEYLATAPWNRNSPLQARRFKGVGSTLIEVSIQYSYENELKGRVGLHSLPGALPFYLRIGFTDLGADSTKQDLHYLELIEAKADAFLREKGGKT